MEMYVNVSNLYFVQKNENYTECSVQLTNSVTISQVF